MALTITRGANYRRAQEIKASQAAARGGYKHVARDGTTTYTAPTLDRELYGSEQAYQDAMADLQRTEEQRKAAELQAQEEQRISEARIRRIQEENTLKERKAQEQLLRQELQLKENQAIQQKHITQYNEIIKERNRLAIEEANTLSSTQGIEGWKGVPYELPWKKEEKTETIYFTFKQNYAGDIILDTKEFELRYGRNPTKEESLYALGEGKRIANEIRTEELKVLQPIMNKYNVPEYQARAIVRGDMPELEGYKLASQQFHKAAFQNLQDATIVSHRSQNEYNNMLWNIGAYGTITAGMGFTGAILGLAEDINPYRTGDTIITPSHIPFSKTATGLGYVISHPGETATAAQEAFHKDPIGSTTGTLGSMYGYKVGSQALIGTGKFVYGKGSQAFHATQPAIAAKIGGIADKAAYAKEIVKATQTYKAIDMQLSRLSFAKDVKITQFKESLHALENTLKETARVKTGNVKFATEQVYYNKLYDQIKTLRQAVDKGKMTKLDAQRILAGLKIKAQDNLYLIKEKARVAANRAKYDISKAYYESPLYMQPTGQMSMTIADTINKAKLTKEGMQIRTEDTINTITEKARVSKLNIEHKLEQSLSPMETKINKAIDSLRLKYELTKLEGKAIASLMKSRIYERIDLLYEKGKVTKSNLQYRMEKLYNENLYDAEKAMKTLIEQKKIQALRLKQYATAKAESLKSSLNNRMDLTKEQIRVLKNRIDYTIRNKYYERLYEIEKTIKGGLDKGKLEFLKGKQEIGTRANIIKAKIENAKFLTKEQIRVLKNRIDFAIRNKYYEHVYEVEKTIREIGAKAKTNLLYKREMWKRYTVNKLLELDERVAHKLGGSIYEKFKMPGKPRTGFEKYLMREGIPETELARPEDIAKWQRGQRHYPSTVSDKQLIKDFFEGKYSYEKYIAEKFKRPGDIYGVHMTESRGLAGKIKADPYGQGLHIEPEQSRLFGGLYKGAKEGAKKEWTLFPKLNRPTTVVVRFNKNMLKNYPKHIQNALKSKYAEIIKNDPSMKGNAGWSKAAIESGTYKWALKNQGFRISTARLLGKTERELTAAGGKLEKANVGFGLNKLSGIQHYQIIDGKYVPIKLMNYLPEEYTAIQKAGITAKNAFIYSTNPRYATYAGSYTGAYSPTILAAQYYPSDQQTYEGQYTPYSEPYSQKYSITREPYYEQTYDPYSGSSTTSSTKSSTSSSTSDDSSTSSTIYSPTYTPPQKETTSSSTGLTIPQQKELVKAFILNMVYGKQKMPVGAYQTQQGAKEEGKMLTDNTKFRRFKITQAKVPRKKVKKGKTYGAEHKFFNMPKGIIQERKTYWKDTKGERKGHFNWAKLLSKA